MKKFDFIPLALLSVLCCSCNDDYENCSDDHERRIVKLDGESSVEDNVEVLDNSTKEIVFPLSQEQKIDVNDKEIILSVNNLGDKSVEIKAPEFIYPQKWRALRVEAQEAAQENGKIKLKSGKNELKYTLITKERPSDEQTGQIKVLFAKKEHIIHLRSYLVENKLTFAFLDSAPLSFMAGDQIKKTIRFKVGNTNDQEETVSLPKFDYPEGWKVKITLDDNGSQAAKDDKITINSKEEKILVYTLIGKAIDKQESAYIKASFAGKIQNIELTSYLLKNNLGFQVKSELTLTKGKLVKGELIFKAISHHTKEETVSVPKFSYPKAWSSVNMELDEKSKQALINNHFKLKPQEEQTLTYTLKATVPSDVQSSGEIKVSFADKELSFPFKLNRAESKLEVKLDSTELTFVKGQSINGRQITLTIKNNHKYNVTVNRPVFTSTNISTFGATLQKGEAQEITFEAEKEKTLTYHLSGSAGETPGEIKVSFADKELSVPFQLVSAESVLEIEKKEESTKELAFLQGQSIGDKQIKVTIKNNSPQTINNIDRPSLTVPTWLSVKKIEVKYPNNTVTTISEKKKIDFYKGITELTYTVGGKDGNKAPNALSETDKITVNFSGKNPINIPFQLVSAESALEIVKEKSTKKLTFLKNQGIEGKQITLTIKNNNKCNVTVNRPVFASANISGFGATLQKGEAQEISFEAEKEKTLIYHLSGSVGEMPGEIKVSFAGKELRVLFQLVSAESGLQITQVIPQNLTFVKGQNIQDKQIKVTIRNNSPQIINNIDSPSLTVPTWLSVKKIEIKYSNAINTEDITRSKKIGFLQSETLELTYTVGGKDGNKAPNALSETDEIKVNFPGKDPINIPFQLVSAESGLEITQVIPQNLKFFKGQSIEDKQITLTIKNNVQWNADQMPLPTLVIPAWLSIKGGIKVIYPSRKNHTTMEPITKQTVFTQKETLKLTYTVGVKDGSKAPNALSENDEIKVNFPGKDPINIPFQLVSSESGLEITQVNPQNLKFLKNQSIDGTTITLKIKKNNNFDQTVNYPVLTSTNISAFGATLQAGEAQNITSEAGEGKTLTYNLSGVVGQKDGTIQVIFTGKDPITIPFELVSAESSFQITQVNPQNLNFLQGQNIEDKQIKVAIESKSNIIDGMTIPSLTTPEWLTIKNNIQVRYPNGTILGTTTGKKINFYKGITELIYTVGANNGNTVPSITNNTIKVSFAGAQSTINVNVVSIQSSHPEELIIGRVYNEQENKHIKFSLSAPTGMQEPFNISLPDSMTLSGKNNGLSAKLSGETSINLKGGEEKEVIYNLIGTPQGEEKAIFTVVLGGVTQNVEIPLKYLSFDQVSFKLINPEDAPKKYFFVKGKPINLTTKILLRRADDQKGDVKTKLSSLLDQVYVACGTTTDVQAVVSQNNVCGITVDLKEDTDVIFKKGDQEILYTVTGTENQEGNGNLAFKLKNNKLPLPIPFEVVSEDFLYKAVENQNTALVKEYVNGKGDVSIINKSDWSNLPIHKAAFEGLEEITQLLINAGADLNAQNAWDYTPFHASLVGKKNNTAQIIIPHLKTKFVQKAFSNTPLHEAVILDNVEIAQALIKAGFGLNDQNKLCYTPLHEAVLNKKVNLVKLLIEKKANVNAEDHLKETPLHIAASMGEKESTILLLSDEKTILNPKSKDNYTPLYNAVKKEKIEIAELIVNAFRTRHTNKQKNNFKEKCKEIKEKDQFGSSDAQIFLEKQRQKQQADEAIRNFVEEQLPVEKTKDGLYEKSREKVLNYLNTIRNEITSPILVPFEC